MPAIRANSLEGVVYRAVFIIATTAVDAIHNSRPPVRPTILGACIGIHRLRGRTSGTATNQAPELCRIPVIEVFGHPGLRPYNDSLVRLVITGISHCSIRRILFLSIFRKNP